ncbi:hypothetical protein [Belnapia sp. F-4-1]|uniref:hypothetical protein n=1 Tax=Belnapia sp. F-4-1 TaxID=1545443 RepID=UPI0005BA787E|nr:hypothetical protein [Belnapia sp. F-4-1]
MGTVHDILEAGGKEAALRADIERAVVEAASLYMADESAGIGFLYSGWCQAALPHRRLPDEDSWQISSGGVALSVEPGRKLIRPPLKWSVLRYGFELEEDRDGEQEAPA